MRVEKRRKTVNKKRELRRARPSPHPPPPPKDRRKIKETKNTKDVSRNTFDVIRLIARVNSPDAFILECILHCIIMHYNTGEKGYWKGYGEVYKEIEEREMQLEMKHSPDILRAEIFRRLIRSLALILTKRLCTRL